MEILSLNDLQNLNQEIQNIYSLDKLENFGLESLKILNRLLQSDISVFHMTKMRSIEVIMAEFAYNSPQRGLTERDRLILNILRPHLIQSYKKANYSQQLRQNNHQSQQILNHLGAITINSTGYIKSIAPQASSWLETYYPKPTLTAHLPDRLKSWVNHQVTHLNQPSERANPDMTTRVKSNDRELTIRLIIKEMDNQYVLLLSEKYLSLANDLKILGLCERETDVFIELMQGKDPQTIATELNITLSTVRKHLENIRGKLGACTMPEAIAHALTQLGIYTP
jgi:DNA-binding CsgD family transcriptional regulator